MLMFITSSWWRLWSRQLSRHISPIFSQLIYDVLESWDRFSIRIATVRLWRTLLASAHLWWWTPTYIFSQLIYDVSESWDRFSIIATVRLWRTLLASIRPWWWTCLSHLLCFWPLLSFICLSIAECIDCLPLLARHSAKPCSLLKFITSSWWRLQPHQLSWHISLIFTAHLWW